MAEFKKSNEGELELFQQNELHLVLAGFDSDGLNVIDFFPMPLQGQNREQYVTMANNCMQKVAIGLSQSVDNVGDLMIMAAAGRPHFERTMPEFVGALKASVRAIVSIIPAVISTIALYKFDGVPVSEYLILMNSLRDSVRHSSDSIRKFVNAAIMLQQEFHAERHPNYPVNHIVEDLPPDASAELIIERINAMKAQEEIFIARDIAEGIKPDYTLYYVLGGLTAVAILTGGVACTFMVGSGAAGASISSVGSALVTAGSTIVTTAATIVSRVFALIAVLATEVRRKRHPGQGLE